MPPQGTLTQSELDAFVQSEQEVDPNFREEIAEGVVRRHVRVMNKKVKAGLQVSENLTHGQMRKAYDAADAASAMAFVRAPGGEPQQPAGAGAHAYVRLPVYAHWFRTDAVHAIERNANIEFFNGASPHKTEAMYVQYRNCLVEEYRRCPSRRLTFLDCRRRLVGDVQSLRRIWDFLDSWGLINCAADPAAVRVRDCRPNTRCYEAA